MTGTCEKLSESAQHFQELVQQSLRYLSVLGCWSREPGSHEPGAGEPGSGEPGSGEPVAGPF